MNNRINIEFLRGQMDKVLTDIEALKDKNREMYYTNGEKMVAEVVALSCLQALILRTSYPARGYGPMPRHKRIAERQFTPNVQYKCLRSKAELEDNIDGTKTIKS